ncbi:MAG: LLM class flavin-dependent oxidoreductase [Acidimicrobiales bacterium]|nr:LLM class flavin-dependent oxidoreductase [Acidimicrobiales bacterium]
MTDVPFPDLGVTRARRTPVGLYLPQLRMDFATIEERVVMAESLGFHSVWFMDHLAAPALPEADTLEGWTVAAALARRTSHIRLGHLTLCTSFRHPALLAKMAATLDVISEGRLDLGLGWGSVEDELRTFGFPDEPPKVRATRLVESLEVLDRMFTGEPFSFKGRFHQLRDAVGRPVPVQQPRIPIHIGGGGRRFTLPIAAHYAEWWNCPSYAVDRLEELLPLAQPARVSVQHVVALASSRANRDEVAAEAERRFGAWGGLVTGTPSEVADALNREVAMGVDLFVCQFSDFAGPKTLRLFAREVLPALRAPLRPEP